MTWALRLPVVEAVGWLGWLFSVFATCTFALTIWRSGRPRSGLDWTPSVGRWGRWRRSIIDSPHRPWYSALGFAIIVCCFLAFAATKPEVYRLTDVYVVGYDSNYHYHLRTKDADFWTVFCSDYEPQFSTGQTLRVLTYEDMGACWSVAHTHPAYLIERDEKGVPILR